MFRMLKRFYKNVEWPSIIGLWGFCTLAVMALSQGYTYYIVIILATMGIIMAILAAYNGFMNKSIALLDKYEEKFFEKLENKRKSAAQFLLGENPQGSCDLENILDFFEAPIAQKVIDNYIDDREVYSYFYHWIRLYWQASQNYISDYRKEEPGAWGSIEKLYKQVSIYEKKEIKKDTGKVCNDNDLVLPPEKINRYLKEEAGINFSYRADMDEFETKCRKLIELANETVAVFNKTAQDVYLIYKLRNQPLSDKEAVTMALAKKIYFSFEALIDDAMKINPFAMHHLKTMAECIIYFDYVANNGDIEAQRVLCEMAKNKQKFIDINSDFSSAKAQSKYWEDVVKSFGTKGISVNEAAKKGGAITMYNRIYRQACEPAHLADLYEYLPNRNDSFELNRSATSPIWVSTALFQAMDLAITLLTDISNFFKLNIKDGLTNIKAKRDKIMFPF